jgi:hypothetical protein
MLNGSIKSGAPAVTLRRWRVIEVLTRDGTRSRHLLGHDVTNDEDRISSAVAEFKMESMTATTNSGVRYRLAGVPGQSRRMHSMWEEWCRSYGVVSQHDVTNDYMDPEDVSTRQFAALNISALTVKPR